MLLHPFPWERGELQRPDHYTLNKSGGCCFALAIKWSWLTLGLLCRRPVPSIPYTTFLTPPFQLFLPFRLRRRCPRVGRKVEGGGVSSASTFLCCLNWSESVLAADEPDNDDNAPTLQRDGRHVLTITWAVRWRQDEGRDGEEEMKGGGGERTSRSREESWNGGNFNKCTERRRGG